MDNGIHSDVEPPDLEESDSMSEPPGLEDTCPSESNSWGPALGPGFGESSSNTTSSAHDSNGGHYLQHHPAAANLAAAGFNPNSRIWQVHDDDADPHEHELGPAPEDEAHGSHSSLMPAAPLVPGIMRPGGMMLFPANLLVGPRLFDGPSSSGAPQPLFVPGGGMSVPGAQFRGILPLLDEAGRGRGQQQHPRAAGRRSTVQQQPPEPPGSSRQQQRDHPVPVAAAVQSPPESESFEQQVIRARDSSVSVHARRSRPHAGAPGGSSTPEGQGRGVVSAAPPTQAAAPDEAHSTSTGSSICTDLSSSSSTAASAAVATARSNSSAGSWLSSLPRRCWPPWELLASSWTFIQQLLVAAVLTLRSSRPGPVMPTPAALSTSAQTVAAQQRQQEGANIAGSAASFPCSFNVFSDQQQQQQPAASAAAAAGEFGSVQAGASSSSTAGGSCQGASEAAVLALGSGSAQRQRLAQRHTQHTRQQQQRRGQQQQGLDDSGHDSSDGDDEPPSWTYPAPPAVPAPPAAVVTGVPVLAAAAAAQAAGSSGSNSPAPGSNLVELPGSRAAKHSRCGSQGGTVSGVPEAGIRLTAPAAGTPIAGSEQAGSPANGSSSSGGRTAPVAAALPAAAPLVLHADDSDAGSDDILPSLLDADDTEDMPPALSSPNSTSFTSSMQAAPAGQRTQQQPQQPTVQAHFFAHLPPPSAPSEDASDCLSERDGPVPRSRGREHGEPPPALIASGGESDTDDDPPTLDDPDSATDSGDATDSDLELPQLEICSDSESVGGSSGLLGLQGDLQDHGQDDSSEHSMDMPGLEVGCHDEQGSAERTRPPAAHAGGLRRGFLARLQPQGPAQQSSSSTAQQQQQRRQNEASQDEPPPLEFSSDSDADSMPDLEGTEGTSDDASDPGSGWGVGHQGLPLHTSGLRRGFLGGPLQESGWSSAQQPQDRHSTHASGHDDDDEDDDDEEEEEDYEGSWQTLYASEAEDSFGSGSVEDEDEDDHWCEEDEDDDDDGDDDECQCGSCRATRANIPMGFTPDAMAASLLAAMGLAPGRIYPRNRSNTRDSRQQSGARSSSSAEAAAAAPFSRPRSNAFMVPGTSSGGGSAPAAAAAGRATPAAAGAKDSSSTGREQTTAQREVKGLPSLQHSRAGRGGEATPSSSDSGSSAAPGMPPGLISRADAAKRVNQLSIALADTSFTQQLLQGLSGVDPAHPLVLQALELLKAKKYTPAAAASMLIVPGKQPRVVAYEELAFSQRALRSAGLVNRWR